MSCWETQVSWQEGLLLQSWQRWRGSAIFRSAPILVCVGEVLPEVVAEVVVVELASPGRSGQTLGPMPRGWP